MNPFIFQFQQSAKRVKLCNPPRAARKPLKLRSECASSDTSDLDDSDADSDFTPESVNKEGMKKTGFRPRPMFMRSRNSSRNSIPTFKQQRNTTENDKNTPEKPNHDTSKIHEKPDTSKVAIKTEPGLSPVRVKVEPKPVPTIEPVRVKIEPAEQYDDTMTNVGVTVKVNIKPHNPPRRANEAQLKYNCRYCRDVLETESEFSLHTRRHIKLLQDFPQKKNFDDEKGLETAKKLYYNNQHPYFCAKCGRSFFNMSQARQHCASGHRGPSNIICLMFKQGMPSDERRFMCFEEFANEDTYIDYDPEAIQEGDPELEKGFLPNDLCSLQPNVHLEKLCKLKPSYRDSLLKRHGVEKFEF